MAELRVCVDAILRVLAHACRHAGLLQFLEVVAEATSLNRAAGSIGLGIEEQHNGLAREAAQCNKVAVLIGQGKVFHGVAGLHGVISSRSILARQSTSSSPRAEPRRPPAYR